MPADEVMHKWKTGVLRSGNKHTGPLVHSQKQAVAIYLSEKRAAQEGKTEYQSSGTQKEHNVAEKGTLFGKPKKDVIRHPGALKRAAKRAGESTRQYAEGHKGDSGTTGKRARLAITLMGMHHG